MKLLDLTFPSAAENLACDEALLESAESGDGGEVLRFWESSEHFVVVGYSNKVGTEVNEPACRTKNIPILRRCSGGGAVLQGPGCLNYTLVLKICDDGPFRSITAANRFIMERNRTVIERLISCSRRREEAVVFKSEVRSPKSEVTVSGHTDLVIDGRKFSGNSQRRRKHFLLFHGTFLLNFDLALIAEVLRMPSKQPDYRADRSHGDFLANLGVSSTSVKDALREAWRAESGPSPFIQIPESVVEKYESREWRFKF